MTKKTERQVFEEVASKLRGIDVNDNIEEVSEIFDYIISELPNGEIKTFFKEVDEDLNRIDDIDDDDNNCLDKMLIIVSEVKEKFKTGSYPKGIPREVARAYENFAKALISEIKQVKIYGNCTG